MVIHLISSFVIKGGGQYVLKDTSANQGIEN